MTIRNDNVHAEWLTVREASEYSNRVATPQTFYRWAKNGLITAIQLPGGTWRISRTAIDEMLTPTIATTPTAGIPVLEGQQELALGRVS